MFSAADEGEEDEDGSAGAALWLLLADEPAWLPVGPMDDDGCGGMKEEPLAELSELTDDDHQKALEGEADIALDEAERQTNNTERT